jgi:branched-chain amino acid aminotransferase
VFLTGSAAGVQYVASIDHRPVGDGRQGPVTQKLAEMYNQMTRGELPRYSDWLVKTYASRAVRA